ncbi:MAG: hypothetical protein A2103_04990 [Gammaproteobacteria bacterium GWF2_41_13]|nr:MAG: hypothetical protein A2103_04990 [Gammaproteobacteria bacterium GWF2_41_13]
MPLQIRRNSVPDTLSKTLKFTGREDFLSPEEVSQLADYYWRKRAFLDEEGERFYQDLFREDPLILGVIQFLDLRGVTFNQVLFEEITSFSQQHQLQRYFERLKPFAEALIKDSGVCAAIQRLNQWRVAFNLAIFDQIVLLSQQNQLGLWLEVLNLLKNAQIVLNQKTFERLAFYIQHQQLRNLFERLTHSSSDKHKIIFREIAVKIICDDERIPIEQLQRWLPIDVVCGGIKHKRESGYPLEARLEERKRSELEVELSKRSSPVQDSDSEKNILYVFKKLRAAGIKAPSVYFSLCDYNIDFGRLVEVLAILDRRHILDLKSSNVDRKVADQFYVRMLAGKKIDFARYGVTTSLAAQIEKAFQGSASPDEFWDNLQLPLREIYRRVLDVARQGQLFQLLPILEDPNPQVNIQQVIQNYCGEEYCDPVQPCPAEKPIAAVIDPRLKGGNPWLDRLNRLFPLPASIDEATGQMARRQEMERSMVESERRKNQDSLEVEVFYSRHSTISLSLDKRIKDMLLQNPGMIPRIIENPRALALVDALSVAPAYPDESTIQRIFSFPREEIDRFYGIVAMQKSGELAERRRLLTLLRLSGSWTSSSFVAQRSQLNVLRGVYLDKQCEIILKKQELQHLQLTRKGYQEQRSQGFGGMVETADTTASIKEKIDQQVLNRLEDELRAIQLRLTALKLHFGISLEQECQAERCFSLQWLDSQALKFEAELSSAYDILREYENEKKEKTDIFLSELKKMGFKVPLTEDQIKKVTRAKFLAQLQGLELGKDQSPIDQTVLRVITAELTKLLATAGLTAAQYADQLRSAGVTDEELADASISSEEIVRVVGQQSSIEFYSLLLQQNRSSPISVFFDQLRLFGIRSVCHIETVVAHPSLMPIVIETMNKKVPSEQREALLPVLVEFVVRWFRAGSLIPTGKKDVKAFLQSKHGEAFLAYAHLEALWKKFAEQQEKKMGSRSTTADIASRLPTVAHNLATQLREGPVFQERMDRYNEKLQASQREGVLSVRGDPDVAKILSEEMDARRAIAQAFR